MSTGLNRQRCIRCKALLARNDTSIKCPTCRGQLVLFPKHLALRLGRKPRRVRGGR